MTGTADRQARLCASGAPTTYEQEREAEYRDWCSLNGYDPDDLAVLYEWIGEPTDPWADAREDAMIERIRYGTE